MKAASQNLCITKQNESLLFQFILSEFIDSYREIVAIHQIQLELHNDFNVAKLELLKASMVKLVGCSKSHMRLFSWNHEDGMLARLKNHCLYLKEAISFQGKKVNHILCKMQFYINKAFIMCVKGLDLLYLNEKVQITEKKIQNIHKFIDQIISPMQKFSKLAASVMEKFQKDENVLFFILRHKPDLDNLYGTQFVFKLINRMYPKGIDQFSEFLVGRYKIRGFHHLIPKIRNKITELIN